MKAVTNKDEKLAKYFADAVKEVLMLSLDKIAEKQDHHDQKFEQIENTLERIEERFNKRDNHLERHDTSLDNYEKRITELEASAN